MRDTGARLFPVVLLALLAALTFWLDQATYGDNGSRDGKHRHDPDYVVERFQVRRFDSAGLLQHSLEAEKMLHYPDDDSTLVIAPRLTYQHDPLTRVASDTARLDRDGKSVRMEGNVRVVRESGDGRPATEISTSVLYADTDEGVAHTDAAVKIVQGKTEINGMGMKTNSKTHLSILYGPVRGTIYPRQADKANR